MRIKETKEVYEGEVTDLTPEEAENPLGGYGKTISHVVVGLKSGKGTKKLRLDPSIYESIQKERVAVGDVIYIEANTGAVKRVGRSDAYATEFDLEAEEYVPIPKGDVHKKKEIVQDVTLHDLDIANAKPQVFSPLLLYSKGLWILIMRLLGRARHNVNDGPTDETQKDRNNRQTPHRN